jgi:hypothetical protein
MKLCWTSFSYVLLTTFTRRLTIAAAHATHNGRSAANTRLNFDGIRKTVHLASSAFHASIAIHDYSLVVSNRENGMGAHLLAAPATVAAFRVQHE